MKRYKFNVEITLDTDEELNNDFIEGLTELLNDEVGDICKVSVKEDLKWQNLKEWIEEREKKHTLILKASAFEDIEILNKMQELEGEDENTRK